MYLGFLIILLLLFFWLLSIYEFIFLLDFF